jgi:hypothetical protein
MNKSTNHKYSLRSLRSNKSQYKICSECNKKKSHFDEDYQICSLCYRAKTLPQSGNKVVDDFINYTLTDRNKNAKKMEFVPYNSFKNVEYIAEGGFSKIYKATWNDRPIEESKWDETSSKYKRINYYGRAYVLKELNNSKSIDSKDLNEV